MNGLEAVICMSRRVLKDVHLSNLITVPVSCLHDVLRHPGSSRALAVKADE